MSDYIPRDVLIDILTRLPAETLVRLTPVCKSWHSLITSPKFISRHLNRNANNDCLLVRYCTEKPKQEHYSLVLDGNDSFRQLKNLDFPISGMTYFSVVGSCNGLICLSDDQGCYMNDMYLWNPSIRRSFALPTYNVTFKSHGPFMHCLGFGFDSVTDDFKVVRVVQTGWGCDRIPPEVEIYTLKTGHWRYISDRALPLMIEERFRQAYVHGAAHWMAFDPVNYGDRLRWTILSFNMSDEVFNEILVPDCITHEENLLKRMILLVFKESLSLIQQCVGDSDPHCSIWIMKEYSVATSWAKLFRIDLFGGLRSPLGLRKNGEVIFATHDGHLVSCDNQSKRILFLGIHGTLGDGYLHWHTFYTDTYVESLVLLDKRGSPGNTERQRSSHNSRRKQEGSGNRTRKVGRA